ncbi:MAG: DUF2325 domain-containing protein [Desulfobacterales bacterium]
MNGKMQATQIYDNKSPGAGHKENGHKNRLKIWEIDMCFRCPIVGGCLTTAEQKSLLKKAGFCIKDKSLYDIHEILVTCCESDNKLSRKLDNLLSRKFNKNAGRLLELDHASFMTYWNKCLSDGDFYEALWAASCRPDLKEASRRKIFGDVHMAMHRSPEQWKKAGKKIAALEKSEIYARNSRKELIKEINTLKKQTKVLEAENHELKVRLTSAAKMNEDMSQRLALAEKENNIPDLEGQIAQLQKQADELSSTISRQNRLIDKLTKENLSTAQKCEQLTGANKELQNYAGSLINYIRQAEVCDESCPAFDLCKRRVLIVGGKTRMEALYRRLVESCGGFLEYHDGNVKGGSRQLENSLKRADIILCPVNCNSHNACSLVKNLAKRHRKPVHMMANFSLNAIFRQINESGNLIPAHNQRKGCGIDPLTAQD